MVTLEDVSSLAISSYVEKCIMYSIPILNSLTPEKISELKELMVKYNARVLSDISLYNLYCTSMMHNFANIQKDMYAMNVIDNINDIIKTTVDTLSIQKVQNISDIMNKKLSDLSFKIEESYGLPRGTIQLYEDVGSEAGIDYSSLMNDYPLIFNFYEGRVIYTQIISLMKEFALTKAKYEDENLSSQYSFVDKYTAMLESVIMKIQNKLSTDSLLKTISDACMIAKIVHKQYNILDQVNLDLFLNRKYSKIREDILFALRNNL